MACSFVMMITPCLHALARLAFALLPAVVVAQVTNVPGEGVAGSRGATPVGTMIAAQALSQGDLDGDGKLSESEWGAIAGAWFESLDSDHAGKVSQEEFIERFGGAVLSQPGRGARGGFGFSPFLGVFVAVDADQNGSLTRAELKETFHRWFQEWDAQKNGALTREDIAEGWASVLPKTNLGTATGREAQTPIPGLPEPPPSPVLPPEEAIQTIQLSDGFRVELAASEPLIEDPIALSFDEDGRAFVVEMRSFMLDINRSGERDPIGRISLLQDVDRDGRFDKASIFVDGLVLPRSVAAVRGGALYVSNYRLYFAEDTDGDGRADRKELVDAEYGGGNVEHAPNGLMPALDNWIYNARSNYRYRWLGRVLVKQRTEFRGQWGMTQDNDGRLFYNVNNSQLLGDLTPPNYMGRNPHHATTAGLNLFVATDQRVFSLRMNTAVNRGYLKDVINPEGKLYVFASSCSPCIYRGDHYPAEFQGNAFVCDPGGNLIKRNLVFDGGLTLTSKFAYEDSEFLASTDERFRPVNLYNGPDGTLWVVDMYRGISQYGMFMTSYLRRETLERGLDQGVHLGRIYRIVAPGKAPSLAPPLSGVSSAVLVQRLSHPNGWIRDTAQRLLVERADRSVVPSLAELARSGTNALGRIHALWTMEGLLAELPKHLNPSAADAHESSAESPAASDVRLVQLDSGARLETARLPEQVLEACHAAIHEANPKIQVAALRVLELLTAANAGAQRVFLEKLLRLEPNAALEVVFQAALSAGNLAKPNALPALAEIGTQFTEHSLIRHAILSGLQNWELQFLQILLVDPRWENPRPGRGALLQALAGAIINERNPSKVEVLLTLAGRQKEEQRWRQRSLIEGIAAHAKNRRFTPIPLAAAPQPLALLAQSDVAQIREWSQAIKKLFSWPGHQDKAEAKESVAAPATPKEEAALAAGKLLYEQVCAGCHGLSGEGITPLAPPLAESDWVLGPDDRLVRIALQGMAGPVHVNGVRYEPPQTLPDMPSLRDALDDDQIAAVLSYIRRGWGHQAGSVTPSRVAQIRQETQNRELPWTEEELLQVK